MQNKEAQVASDVAQKLLEVQKDKHQSLRTGYTGLYSATMSRLKKHVEVQEKMRELVNAFPNVVARNEDGTYEFEPCAQNQEQDVWWQGEQLQKMLRDIKGQHEEEKRVIQKQVIPLPPLPPALQSHGTASLSGSSLSPLQVPAHHLIAPVPWYPIDPICSTQQSWTNSSSGISRCPKVWKRRAGETCPAWRRTTRCSSRT